MCKKVNQKELIQIIHKGIFKVFVTNVIMIIYKVLNNQRKREGPKEAYPGGKAKQNETKPCVEIY